MLCSFSCLQERLCLAWLLNEIFMQKLIMHNNWTYLAGLDTLLHHILPQYVCFLFRSSRHAYFGIKSIWRLDDTSISVSCTLTFWQGHTVAFHQSLQSVNLWCASLCLPIFFLCLCLPYKYTYILCMSRHPLMHGQRHIGCAPLVSTTRGWKCKELWHSTLHVHQHVLLFLLLIFSVMLQLVQWPNCCSLAEMRLHDVPGPSCSPRYGKQLHY